MPILLLSMSIRHEPVDSYRSVISSTEILTLKTVRAAGNAVAWALRGVRTGTVVTERPSSR